MYSEHAGHTAAILASVERVFDGLDDQRRLSQHMSSARGKWVGEKWTRSWTSDEVARWDRTSCCVVAYEELGEGGRAATAHHWSLSDGIRPRGRRR